jgi:hypothetical protein
MTNYREIDGIKYAEGVKAAKAGPMSQDLIDSLKEPAKIRITTMIDVDVYNELKRLADLAGHGKYQSALNAVLRTTLLPGDGPSLTAIIDTTKYLSQAISETKSTIEKLSKKINVDNNTLKAENKHIKNQLKEMWKMMPARPKRRPAKKKANG